MSAVRIWKTVQPLNMTDVLVTYEEDGLLRNIILRDASLAGRHWALQARRAEAKKDHDGKVMAAQAVLNETVSTAEAAYKKALADAQQAFVATADAAEQAMIALLAPLQSEFGAADATAYAAADKALPPLDA